MRDLNCDSMKTSRDAGEIARDLRHYAQAGLDPAFAAKLLAAARELDDLAIGNCGSPAQIRE